ncbi:MAG: trypsin-like peptidase domain-containing protein [Pirellulaceae bacterium]|nr:trypsin-like peptidase domain-containing protein [Pirellulaceae bacterium]HJN11457.1 trypsin-like peptidase domain-containing protein [Pirellulaceae bacterium]
MKRLNVRFVNALSTMLFLFPTVSLAADDVPEVVLQAQRQRTEAIARAVASAISVFSADGNGGGSGVVISADGYALSNFHVTSPVGEYMQCSMSDGRLYDAVIVGLDPTGDVALIKLFGRDDFPTAVMADSNEVRAGDWCFAIGNPFLLATDFQPTVTYGIVSGVHRYQFPAGTILEYADCIQTDASINPGNSGGPLFNAEGRLIGINGRGSFEKRGRVNVGLGYAISINQIKNFMGHLRSGRIVDHATLGATVSVDQDGRVVVSNILESSDAYRRGLRYGDEVLRFGGRQIGSVNGFKNVLGIYPRGWRVPLTCLRDGQQHEMLVRLAGVHAREKLIELVQKQTEKERRQPKPRPQPPGKEPGKQPGEPEEKPASPHGPKAAVIPDEFAKFIKKRTGFANYYFNQQSLQRVWNGCRSDGDFSKVAGVWSLTGQAADAGQVAFQLGHSDSVAMVPAGRSTVVMGTDFSEQLGPAGSGGLLAALHIWRRVLIEGPSKIGDAYYLGTQPLRDHDGLYDVVVVTFDVVEVQMSFDPESGRLMALEMFPELGQDPCEIYFDDYREVVGLQAPHRIIVRHGGGIFAEIEFVEIELAEAKEEL